MSPPWNCLRNCSARSDSNRATELNSRPHFSLIAAVIAWTGRAVSRCGTDAEPRISARLSQGSEPTALFETCRGASLAQPAFERSGWQGAFVFQSAATHLNWAILRCPGALTDALFYPASPHDGVSPFPGVVRLSSCQQSRACLG